MQLAMILTYDHPEAAEKFLKEINPKKDLNGLAQLVEAFLKYPYENISKIVRAKDYKTEEERLRLPEIVLNEHIEYGAGGTCFSLTYYFESILKSAGFDCYSVMVDRSYGPNTHCAIIVRLDGKKYLVDPGYCLSRPVLLTDKPETYKLPHNTYLINPSENNSYLISTNQAGSVKVRYRLKDAQVNSADFLKFWNDSFNWPMMRQLCVTQLKDDGYLFLRNENLRMTTQESKKQEKIKDGYEKRVQKIFGISERLIENAISITKISNKL